jgi:hypothetical protein
MTGRIPSAGTGDAFEGSVPPADVATAMETRPGRRARLTLVAGVVVLVVGIIVCVLGRFAASNASDALATTNRGLGTQRELTRRALRCEVTLRAGLTPIVASAEALLGTAAGINDQNAQIVAAQHDMQTAGSQSRIDDYNNAVDRENIAAAAANRGIEAARSQAATLQQGVGALPSPCP